MPKGLPSKGIYGWDSTNETWVKVLVDSDGKVQITSTDLTTILSEIQNATYGLEALDTDLGTLLTRLSATRAGYLDELDFDLDARLGTPSGASMLADIVADFDRHLSHVDFWSATDDVITITATADQDYNLPDVTVPALPTGATIWKVYLLFKCTLIRDTSGSDNGIDEAGIIRIKKDGDAAFDANGVTAYTIADNMWLVDVTNVGRDRGGDAFVGNTDISAKVDGADTYNIRLDSISADGSNLELHEVCIGLRIYFY